MVYYFFYRGGISSRLEIWIANIYNSNFDRHREELVLDVENLLIHVYNPIDNTQGKNAYNGRPNLKVINKGCPHLSPDTIVVN